MKKSLRKKFEYVVGVIYETNGINEFEWTSYEAIDAEDAITQHKENDGGVIMFVMLQEDWNKIKNTEGIFRSRDNTCTR